ncbi:zinc finger protein Gfi-1b [Biomphalaria glabrata]|uniref:Zinc finger protein Gfi-1b-like n=1 Tax=Biomphalaria glabrata TaxID=6526 RepID=A0A9U8EFU8_BIOGL|nr:zinc finger protein Gfi-1b-like [Biomphalaria glabrata]XP_055868976.1 zinc finger protein Gfi-1b-like [Biomphalaria glabrata]XP_055868977.1 zinc finger protein Gfi-1b-like [Biomphalaria glabrata]
MTSVMEGHLSAFNQGPLRPIPIHLSRPPPLEYVAPIQLKSEKGERPKPALWNPALDLSPSSKSSTPKDGSDVVRKRRMMQTTTSNKKPSTPPPLPPPLCTLSPVAMKNTPLPPGLSLPLRQMQSDVIHKTLGHHMPNKELILSGGSPLYHQIQRHIVPSIDNPLAFLASKGVFFSNLFGAAGALHHHDLQMNRPQHAMPTLPNSERHMSMQNAIAIAQSRSVLERLSTSSHSHLPQGRPLDQHQASRHQHPPQPPAPSQVPHQSQAHVHQSPIQDRPLALQNAMALVQTQALMERVNGSGQVMSPLINMDASVNHGYGRKLFPCPQCRYTTDRRNNLKRHMLTMHQTSAKMLECCGILFNTKASLREHAMIFHYHGYTCYFCGRRFCRKALLKRHLSVHNGQKDFVCNVCDYATSHKSNLERHRKVHSRQDDGKDGEERYHDDETRHYHDDVKSNGSEAVSHYDVSSDELSVCSDFDDDIDVEINVHSD